MLFNLFKKIEPAVIFTDKIFISTEAKINACIALAKQEPDVLLIAWFADTVKEYQSIFARELLDKNKIVDVKHLHAGKINNYRPVFLEHFPLHIKEKELVKKWGLKKIDVYNSLQEPLFTQLGGENIIALMKQMGTKENEMMEHPLISKSIRNAQEKIAQKLNFEHSADSQKEWIEKNIC